MPISIDYGNTNIISIPQADLTFISGVLYELDVNAFRQELNAYQDDAVGMPFPTTHTHNTEITIAGVTSARSVSILPPYRVQFEDGQYSVRLVGANNNLFDEGIIVRNQVSIVSTNSAGLIVVSQGSGLSVDEATRLRELHQLAGLESGTPVTITDDDITFGTVDVDINRPDANTTTLDRQ